jgi:putative colanic acid biosynthesis acetyltransferase WcaF
LARSFPLTLTRLTLGNKLARLLWGVVSNTLYRYSPKVLHAWRCFLLRCFGATVGPRAHPCPRSRVWAPWNLTMEADSCLADDVDCYCVAPITLGRNATVSQYSYLCAASHDFRDPALPLTTAPIVVEAHAWVAADVFVGPGVRIGEGAVVGARSTVMHDVEPWTVVAGAPPRLIGQRRRITEPAAAATPRKQDFQE